jgi:hypothetical protein
MHHPQIIREALEVAKLLCKFNCKDGYKLTLVLASSLFLQPSFTVWPLQITHHTPLCPTYWSSLSASHSSLTRQLQCVPKHHNSFNIKESYTLGTDSQNQRQKPSFNFLDFTNVRRIFWSLQMAILLFYCH